MFDALSPNACTCICMLHPDSLLRLLWSVIGMWFLLFDFGLLTMNVFGIARPREFDLADACYWTCDVIVNFRTGCRKEGKLDMSARSIARAYMRGWFSFDVSIILFQWIVTAAESPSAVRSAGIVRYSRFLRLVRLLRLTKLQLMLDSMLQRLDNIFALLAIKCITYIGCLTTYVHISATIFYVIGQSEDDGWVNKYDGIFEQWPLNYVGSFMWAVTQMQGSAEVMPGNLRERIFGSCHYLCSIIVLSLFISKLTTVLQAIENIKADGAKLTRVAYAFMKQNKISVESRIMLQHFLKDKATIDKKSQASPDQSSLFDVLPPSLRNILLVEARWPVVGKALLMQTCERLYPEFANQVTCNLMHAAFYPPSEKVFQEGVSCSSMYFLVAGVAWYVPYTWVVSHVQSNLAKSSPQHLARWKAEYFKRAAQRVDDVGTAWCEPALFVRWIHVGTLQSDPYSALSLLALDAQAFEELHVSY